MRVREFVDGCEIAQVLLVREVEPSSRRDGGEYLKLMIGDRTGTVPAVVWDGVVEARELCLPGEVVHACGRYSVHPRFGPQLTITALRTARPNEFDRDELLDGPLRSPDQMEADLRELLATVQDPHLRLLLPRSSGTARRRGRAPDAPAASAITRRTATACSSTR